MTSDRATADEGTDSGRDGGGELFVPAVTGTATPDPRVLPASPVTRFAPAPTGPLHLGHLVNILYVWGIARATGGQVVLRIEDHDRQRSRPEHEAALLDDLERVGVAPDLPALDSFRLGASPYRQSDNAPAYAAALEPLRGEALVYACGCSRSTFAAYEAANGRPWRGIGCPGRCRAASLPESDAMALRVAVGAGSERWVDLLAGPLADEPAASGDPLVRDRLGNWTYAWCVVVDDMRHGTDLVVRGRDLLEATPVQLRLARLLGREVPPGYLHHPLIRRRSGQKLSKAAGDTAIRALLDAGRTPAELFGLAARLAGLQPDDAPIDPATLGRVFSA
ncbi:MAG TPA: glutamate--tRNA ligase family protein [Candidatus Limnocylindrales bacterium]|nr:glutamate--tRNA ligase family protein [Candidatus Limnocylindrales bacterium]